MAKTKKCVRVNDLKGFETKLYKTQLQNPLTFYYAVKCQEQWMRGSSPTSVAKIEKFQKFGSVSEGLKLEPLLEGFQSFSFKEKKQTTKKLVDELYEQIASSMSRRPVQGADIQADYPGDMQVGEGSGPDPASEGVPSTSLPPDDSSLQNVLLGSVRSDGLPGDVDMQVNNPDQIQVEEVWAAAPNPDLGNTLSNDASLQNVAWNEPDNSQGRPPLRPPVPVEEIVSIMRDLEHRASRFPGISRKVEWSEETFRSSVKELEYWEYWEFLEGILEDGSNTLSRSRLDEICAPLEDFPA